MERMKILLCDFSAPPWPEAQRWDDEQLWQWWETNRDRMMRAAMEHAVQMSKEIPETMGMPMFWGPDETGVPAAAVIWDGWRPPKEPGPRKPAEVVEFQRKESEENKE